MMDPHFREMDVVILCGGMGTRLQPVIADRPKSLAPLGDSTFLDILIDSLKKYGFRKFILCTGYMKEQILGHYKDTDDDAIVFSEEDTPLGTGGALKNAQSLISSGTVLVMNGDSICDVDFNKFYTFHTSRKALLSMALVTSKDRDDFGSVFLNESGKIVRFREKDGSASQGFINAGIYLMDTKIFAHMPVMPRFSLEYDFFPGIIRENCYGFVTGGELMDIGTPERFEKAAHFFGK
jgi:NDP-sugar pyrophosphorylase family protein